jgi:hypothetical protein
MIVIPVTFTSEAILVGKVSTHVAARIYSVFPGIYRAIIIRTTFALNFEKFVVNRIFVVS